MSKRYITYEDIRKIQKDYDPQYIMLISARNDGKSYAVKEHILRNYLDKGEKACYLRRNEVDIKGIDQSLYWADFMKLGKNKIEELTGGEWSAITHKKDGFHLAKTGEDGKMVDGDLFAYVHALSIAKRYKSLQFPDVSSIVFEEFVTDSGYLFKEPSRLQQYISTVFRGTVEGQTCFLVGNTISKLNPYFREWQMEGFRKMKPGQIDIYDYSYTPEDFDGEEGEPTTTRIAVHIPDTSGKAKGKSMFFGASAGMIAGQRWDAQEQPHLRGRRRDYDALYQIVVDCGVDGRFLLTLLQKRSNPDVVLWYVEPKTTDIQKGTRIIGTDVVEGSLWTRDFYPITKEEARAFQIMRWGRVVYSDNLTGTEYKRAVRQIRMPEVGVE